MEFKKHQVEALDYLSKRDSAGLFDEMGLGKTVVMLEHLKRMNREGKAPWPVFIVCPLSVVQVWAKEIDKFNYNFKVSILVGSYRERLKALEVEADVYIINYEGLRVIGPNKLLEKNFTTVILDESHRIKNRTSIQSKIALALSRVAKYRFVLTGTPITKSPEDMWPQINFIDPEILGNFWSFRGRYIEFQNRIVRSANGSREIKIPYKYKNLKELEQKISEHSIRRTKKECLTLPEKIYKTIYCPFTKTQEKHYYNLKNSLAISLEEKTFNFNTASSLVQKLRQVCQGFIYTKDEKDEQTVNRISSGKLDILKDLLKDLEDEKVILFAWFQADIDILYDTLKSKYNVILFDGSSAERTAMIEQFQNDDKPAIFLAQTKKAESGITLTKANHVIYFGNTPSYEIRKQSEDRAHRIGKKKHVIYYDFVVPNSVDEIVLENLQRKEDLADKVNGDSMRIKDLSKQIIARGDK